MCDPLLADLLVLVAGLVALFAVVTIITDWVIA